MKPFISLLGLCRMALNLTISRWALAHGFLTNLRKPWASAQRLICFKKPRANAHRLIRRAIAIKCYSSLLLFPGLLLADSPTTQLFNQHCTTCHGADQQEGKLRFDQPLPELKSNTELLQKLIGVLQRREMPPADEPQPTDQLRASVVKHLKEQLLSLAVPGTLKRLTREEFTNTINDLLQTQFNFTELLPEDAVGDSFNKEGDSLLMSPHQVQSYLKAARFVANAVVMDQRPEESRWDFTLNNFRGSGRGDFQTDEAHILTTNYPWRSNLHFLTDPDQDEQFAIPEFGRYRFEATVSVADSAQDQTIGVNSGDPRYATNLQKITRFVLPSAAQSLTFELTLTQGTHVSFTFDSSPIWILRESAKEFKNYAGPKLVFTRVQVRGPLFEQWPTVAEQRLLNCDLSNSRALTEHLVDFFIHRPLPDEAVEQLVQLAQQTRAEGGSPKLAARRVITAILSSPYFLYKHEPAMLDDVAIAHRLAYFLSNAGPDTELLEAARSGQLQTPQGISKQVERLLASPKIDRFCEDFTRQWLRTDKVDDVAPDNRLYPDVSTLQINALAGETQAFFREILAKRLSMLNFIDSDFMMVNDLAAEFYGLPKLDGREFRPCPVPTDSERGGLVGQAGFLKLTSGSFRTSPIIRGVWILKNLYGTSLDVPDDVKVEEPDIRGAKTIQEVMAKHQRTENCRRCHAQIDPLGLALEHYDQIGRWRDDYAHVEASGNANDSRTLKTISMPITTETTLFDGRSLDSMRSLKRILMDDREKVLRGILGKLIAYSTGRPTGVQDESFVNDVYEQIAPNDFVLHDAIIAIATHPDFRRK